MSATVTMGTLLTLYSATGQEAPWSVAFQTQVTQWRGKSSLELQPLGGQIAALYTGLTTVRVLMLMCDQTLRLVLGSSAAPPLSVDAYAPVLLGALTLSGTQIYVANMATVVANLVYSCGGD